MRTQGLVVAGFEIGYGYRSLVLKIGGPAHGFFDIAFFILAGIVIYAIVYGKKDGPDDFWPCGCGHRNGLNLAFCAACGRDPRGDHQ